MPDITTTLAERHTTHGNFTDNAFYSQRLKLILHSAYRWPDLDWPQQEALDYFCCKIARILSTSGRNIDDWHDIAGYATLVEKWLKGETL